MEFESLSLENIMDEAQLNELFPNETQEKDTPEEKPEQEETTEVIGNPFAEEPESVGSEEEHNKEQEDAATEKKSASTSPNFYSSIASALVEDSIFQNLDKEKLSEIKDAEDFGKIVEEEISSRLTEEQKRIQEYMNAGVEPSEYQKNERVLQYLDSLTEGQISNESEEGEDLRKNIIYQDYINRGFSKERAAREVERSFKAGTDVEDAKEALQSNKEFFKEQSDKLLKQAKEEQKAEEAKLKKQAEELRTSILEEKKAYGEIDIDKNTRQKVYDAVMKPVYKDPNTGEMLTAIQKYEQDNRNDFLKNIGLMFVLTDGFKNLDGLVKPKVNKEVKKGLRELERTINNTVRTSSGNLNFASGVDSNSKYSKFDLDLD